MHLSVIIPTLSRPQTALLIATRLRELFPTLEMEVIIVQPADAGASANVDGVRFIRESRSGVYMAFRAGIENATGEYCWFMGDDDYPLDAATDWAPALLAGRIDLLIAPVMLSSGRAYRPTRSLLILQFLNWCQQGVIYRRTLLLRYRLFRRLTVQADQYVNILMRSDSSLKLSFFSRPVCVFGVDGVSGRHRDFAYASLRVALARRTLDSFSFCAFRVLLFVEPLVKRVVRIR